MAQLGRGLRLAGEPLADVLLEGELGRQDLDGHPALQPLVPGAVHHAHAAAADFSLDGIGVTQRRGEPSRQRLVGRGGHRREGPEATGAKRRSAIKPAKALPDMADNLYSHRASRYPEPVVARPDSERWAGVNLAVIRCVSRRILPGCARTRSSGEPSQVVSCSVASRSCTGPWHGHCTLGPQSMFDLSFSPSMGFGRSKR